MVARAVWLAVLLMSVGMCPSPDVRLGERWLEVEVADGLDKDSGGYILDRCRL